jgi:hypothetical protein
MNRRASLGLSDSLRNRTLFHSTYDELANWNLRENAENVNRDFVSTVSRSTCPRFRIAKVTRLGRMTPLEISRREAVCHETSLSCLEEKAMRGRGVALFYLSGGLYFPQFPKFGLPVARRPELRDGRPLVNEARNDRLHRFDDPCGPPGPAPNDSRPGRSQRAQAWARAVFHLADVTGLLAATWVAVPWSSRWSTSDCSSSPIRYPLGPRPDLYATFPSRSMM